MRRLLPLLLVFLAACGGPQHARVVSVIDGDTIVVALDNDKTERVRIVGIDTPETVDPRKPVGCFGPEASTRAKELLFGEEVILERKPDENRDKYDRLLRYITLNGEDVGALLIREGFAKSYPYFPHPRLESYEELQDEAKEAGKGLWGACTQKGR